MLVVSLNKKLIKSIHTQKLQNKLQKYLLQAVIPGLCLTKLFKKPMTIMCLAFCS